MADSVIEIDVRKALNDIAQLKGGLADVQTQVAKTGQAISSALSPESAKGVADAVNDLQKEYADLKRSADVLKNALKGATDPTLVDLYVKSIVQLEAGMSKLEQTAKKAGVSVKESNKEAGTGKQVFEGLFGTFTKVSLILGALAAVKEFVSSAVGLSEQIQTASRSFEAFTGSAAEADKIVNDLVATGQKKFIPTDQILEAGKVLLSVGESANEIPDIISRIADVSAGTGAELKSLVDIYSQVKASGTVSLDTINQLTGNGIPIIQEFAKQLGVSNEKVLKLASEGKISFEELQLAMFNLTAEGGKFANQAEAQSNTISGAWNKLVATVQPAIEYIGGLVSDLVQGALNALTFVAEGIRDLFSDTPKVELVNVDLIDKEALDADRRDYENFLAERERLEKEAEQKRKERNKVSAADAAKAEKERQNAIIAGMKDGVDKEVAIENLRYSELLKLLKKYHIDATDAEQQHQNNLAEIYQKEADRQKAQLKFLLDIRQKINEADIKAAEEAEKARKDKIKTDEAGIEKTRALREQEIDIQEQAGIAVIDALKRNGASEETIKQAQLELDRQLQLARLQNELDAQKALLEITDVGDTQRVQSILNNIKLIEAKIGNLGNGANGDNGGKKPKGLLERLGLDPESIKALDQAIGEVVGLLQDLTAANVQAAEERLQAAQDAVQEAEDALEKEKDLKEQGFASDVELKERELQKAKEDEAKALAQKKAAQRQQLALDSALQLSSLITSAANILKGWSTLPFVGQALGIAAVAAMFASFAAVKARAFSATKLKHGGQGRVDGNSIIVGPSHDDGGVGIEAEGGEFFTTDGKRFGVVNKRMTAKHFSLLDAVNRDDKAGMRRALAELSTPALNQAAVSRSISTNGGSHATDSPDTYGLLKQWHSEEKNKPQITIEGNYRVERRGSITKRVKIA